MSCGHWTRGGPKLLTHEVSIIVAVKSVDWTLETLEFLRFISDPTLSESWAL